jgi:hypothetical protein
VDDVRRAMLIYGPDAAVVKGKTVRGFAAPRVTDFYAVTIPLPIIQHHLNVTLCMDFFYVQGQVFFHAISGVIQHRIVNLVPDQTKQTIAKCVDSTIRLYSSRGFQVVELHADSEYECIREQILPIQMNAVAADSHVGEVEHSIRTIKERNRSTVHGLPYKRLSRLRVSELVKHSVLCLNQIPADDGVSDTLSPNTIMTGNPNPDYNQLKLEFGTFVQVY